MRKKDVSPIRIYENLKKIFQKLLKWQENLWLFHLFLIYYRLSLNILFSYAIMLTMKHSSMLKSKKNKVMDINGQQNYSLLSSLLTFLLHFLINFSNILI